jgi:hypothetical protein
VFVEWLPGLVDIHGRQGPGPSLLNPEGSGETPVAFSAFEKKLVSALQSEKLPKL